jgi:hypothetical protein
MDLSGSGLGPVAGSMNTVMKLCVPSLTLREEH